MRQTQKLLLEKPLLEATGISLSSEQKAVDKEKAKEKKSIAIYAVFLPQFRRNTGTFIKEEAFQSERNRQKILTKNYTWLNKNRYKLQVCIIYEHPGNRQILRYPANPSQAYRLNLWMKFKPWYRGYQIEDSFIQLDGTLTISKWISKKDFAYGKVFQGLMERCAREVSADRLWIAQIRRYPDNHLMFQWSERDGETHPGNLLEAFMYET